jgi:predicted RNA-binding Zn ribbon-like protein
MKADTTVETGRAPFLFVGNQRCLDFINTEMIIKGSRTDLLETPADLQRWAVQAGVLSRTEAGPAADVPRVFREARAFRATLREMAERIVAGRLVPAEALESINRLLSRGPGYPQIQRAAGRFERRFHSTAGGTAHVLVSLAEAAADLLCAGDLSLVKKCRHDACILYFYDTTKNHTRQWCSMELCGNRMKAAAHYRRKKKGG